jgi:hypothetical protein
MEGGLRLELLPAQRALASPAARQDLDSVEESVALLLSRSKYTCAFVYQR